MMTETILEKYADLILKKGVHLIEGQNVAIRSEPCHWSFINLLVKRAYQLGARNVRLDILHPEAHIARTRYQKDAYLEEAPSYTEAMNQATINEHWARIFIEGMADPNIYALANQERNATIMKATSALMRPVLNASSKGICTWTIAPMPTAGWAKQVLGIDGPDEWVIGQFWQILKPILRLDHADPITAWEDHSQQLKKRVTRLGALEIDYLHYLSPAQKTDLKIYLANDVEWAGGAFQAYDERPFLPNIPTEEVFSCPHRDKTEGVVQVTRPVKVFGTDIIGARFEFKHGKVVKFDADQGKDVLAKYLEMDEGARALGEVALVDKSSPIYQAKRTFNSILLDENASCHIALGNGIGSCFKKVQGAPMSDEEMKKRGFNASIVHTDFMIGADDLLITAHTKSGQSIVIMKDGLFTLP